MNEETVRKKTKKRRSSLKKKEVNKNELRSENDNNFEKCEVTNNIKKVRLADTAECLGGHSYLALPILKNCNHIVENESPGTNCRSPIRHFGIADQSIAKDLISHKKDLQIKSSAVKSKPPNFKNKTKKKGIRLGISETASPNYKQRKASQNATFSKFFDIFQFTADEKKAFMDAEKSKNHDGDKASAVRKNRYISLPPPTGEFPSRGERIKSAPLLIKAKKRKKTPEGRCKERDSKPTFTKNIDLKGNKYSRHLSPQNSRAFSDQRRSRTRKPTKEHTAEDKDRYCPECLKNIARIINSTPHTKVVRKTPSRHSNIPDKNYDLQMEEIINKIKKEGPVRVENLMSMEEKHRRSIRLRTSDNQAVKTNEDLFLPQKDLNFRKTSNLPTRGVGRTSRKTKQKKQFNSDRSKFINENQIFNVGHMSTVDRADGENECRYHSKLTKNGEDPTCTAFEAGTKCETNNRMCRNCPMRQLMARIDPIIGNDKMSYPVIAFTCCRKSPKMKEMGTSTHES